MKLLRLPDRRPLQRWLAASVIALLGAGVGIALWAPVRLLGVVRTADNVFYDSLYRLRSPGDQRGGPIVIVAVDDTSLEMLKRTRKVGWPWPRKYWGQMVSYLDSVGARQVVFDLLFDEPSVWNREGNDDDRAFGEAIDGSGTPALLATRALPGGAAVELAPPVMERLVGAANVSDEAIIRSYAPVVNGWDSVALAAAKRAGIAAPDWGRGATPFLLRYYGPHARDGVPVTFRYVRAASVLAAADDPAAGARVGITPDLFKDKIVFVAATSAGTYDLKASPLSARVPGAEVHATALQNMIDAQRVSPVGVGARVLVLVLACLVAAAGSVLPARVPLKMLGGLCGAVVVLGPTAWLFLRSDVRWHPPTAALVATALTAFGGIAWSYLTEVRQRRLIARAFTQYVSKDVVDEMLRDPRKIALGGDRREMTVMFTDIANFTGLSEALDVEGVARMLNFYLEEMSKVILQENGTLDKYIGDSIMSFWNAPTNQGDHAIRACRAALEMREREQRVAAELAELAGGVVYSRVGINSGPMIVGNMGSSAKFNYTVLGDSVNLASRLEGANKIYDTRALLTETTANLVRDHFVIRKVDLIRVKGRSRPMAIYELLGEGKAEARQAELVARYEAALALYQSAHFDQADQLLRARAVDFPGDGPTGKLIARIAQFRASPPPADWDGVFVAQEK